MRTESVYRFGELWFDRKLLVQFERKSDWVPSGRRPVLEIQITLKMKGNEARGVTKGAFFFGGA